MAGIVREARSLIAGTQSRVHPRTIALVRTGRTARTTPFDSAGAAIDLTTSPSAFVQPDHTTCGSSVLVMARMINHPEYAATILDPTPGGPVPNVTDHFHADVLAMHELTNTVRDETGRWQTPWPKGLGTLPWAVARRMSEPGGCGVTGTTYRVRYADPSHLETHLDAIATALAAGHCAPIFIGDALSPRHVVLALDATSASFGWYDPSRGSRVSVGRAEILANQLSVAGWSQLWLSILPRR
ncbi:MAG: hypothetical protein JWM76_2720 [Pseudonocardiales bacterium]|nr:hypothetical protein [Pseudonocardiales bacterium]